MLTKIEAAEKQLDTAIKLFFKNIDTLAPYTLAVASQEITDDLCEHREDELYRSELERIGDAQNVRLSFRYEMAIHIKTEHLKQAMCLIRKPQNFLKHADRDPEQEIEKITLERLAFVILWAIKNFVLLEKRWSPAMSLFFCWFAAQNPQLLKKDVEGEFFSQINKLSEEISDLGLQRTLDRFYVSLKLNAPYLFPQNLP